MAASIDEKHEESDVIVGMLRRTHCARIDSVN